MENQLFGNVEVIDGIMNTSLTNGYCIVNESNFNIRETTVGIIKDNKLEALYVLDVTYGFRICHDQSTNTILVLGYDLNENHMTINRINISDMETVVKSITVPLIEDFIPMIMYVDQYGNIIVITMKPDFTSGICDFRVRTIDKSLTNTGGYHPNKNVDHMEFMKIMDQYVREMFYKREVLGLPFSISGIDG